MYDKEPPNKDHQYFSYIELSLILSAQFKTLVSTAMEFITKNKRKDGPIVEISNNKYIVNDLTFVEENLKDPIPPKFYAANYKSKHDKPLAPLVSPNTNN